MRAPVGKYDFSAQMFKLSNCILLFAQKKAARFAPGGFE